MKSLYKPAETKTGWLTLQQTAKEFGLNLRTMRHWIQVGWFAEANGLRRLGEGHLYRVDPEVFAANPPHKPGSAGSDRGAA